MPNRLGGKKFKRGKKFSKFASKQTREIIYKNPNDNQEYARLEKNLGHHRFEILCADGEKSIAHIPGSFHKRVWCSVGDYVLVSKRAFQLDKCDILYKYFPAEVEQLRLENRLGRLNDEDPTSNEVHDSEFDHLIDPSSTVKNGLEEMTAEEDDFFTKVSDDANNDDFFTKVGDDANNEDFFQKVDDI